jgi:hypothetical protein
MTAMHNDKVWIFLLWIIEGKIVIVLKHLSTYHTSDNIQRTLYIYIMYNIYLITVVF